MSKWGDTVPVEVMIPPHISHTGTMCMGTEQIDRDIAPYIERLNQVLGIRTVQSCCGHEKYEGTGEICSGHLWVVVPDFTQFEKYGLPMLRNADRANLIERVAKLYIPEECLEFVFLGSAHGKLGQSMKMIIAALIEKGKEETE